jgi:dipeptidyl-peptidase-4
MMNRIAFSILLAGLNFMSAHAQLKPLNNDQYFKNNFKGIVVSTPPPMYWLDDRNFVMTKEGKRWVVDAKTGKEREATEQDSKKSAEGFPAVFNRDNDIFIKYRDREIRLTNDAEKEVNATLSPDSQYVAFTKNNDLYSVEIKTQKAQRLTFDGSELILNGYASWVYMEEILGRASQYRAFWWSPDSKQLAFFRSDDSQVPEFVMTDANGLHGYIEKLRYPKAGDPNPEVRVGMVAPTGGNIVWAEFDPKADQYFGLPYWMPDGQSLLVQWMNREQDELQIWKVDPKTGKKSMFMQEQQKKSWINLDDEGERITFLSNNKGFVYLSDASGNKQAFLYDMNGKLKSTITPADANLTDIVWVDEKNQCLYFQARKENSARKDLYKAKFDGKKCARLTFGDYHHASVNLSPGGSYFITTYQNASTPTQMALVNNAGKKLRDLFDARATDFSTTALAKTELIRVKSEDSLFDLPMRVTWPTNMEKGKRYPVLISIYGGPNAGTVMDTWILTGAQQWYAKEGLIQVAMDHRASGHFGKKGVNYMYHNLGYWEMKDYSSMVKWLIANGQADPEKICITGFSYGGYMSCYALTYGADVFTHAMAGGSVVDWSLYDSHYTERFMGTPKNNPAGYKSSSVLTHVEKYKGKLQLVHGIIDENVHLQNSVQLATKLQELKKDFEYMTYSGSRHGWGGNKGLHFQNLKTRFIYNHLLEKDVPAEMLK